LELISQEPKSQIPRPKPQDPKIFDTGGYEFLEGHFRNLQTKQVVITKQARFLGKVNHPHHSVWILAKNGFEKPLFFCVEKLVNFLSMMLFVEKGFETPLFLFLSPTNFR